MDRGFTPAVVAVNLLNRNPVNFNCTFRRRTLFSAALFTASVAGATDRATWEGFLGYNLVTFNPNAPNLSSFTANGGSGQLVHNFTPSVGVVFDIGAVHSGTPFSALNNITPNRNVDHTMVNFVAGPRFTYQNHSRFLPFAQIMFGGTRSTSTTSITLLQGGTIWPPPGLIVPPGCRSQLRRSSKLRELDLQ